MKETLSLLQEFCALRAVSGGEEAAAKQLADRLAPYCQTVQISPNHSVMGLVVAPKEGRPLLMLDAHLDEIGLMITHIEEDGFARVAPCGGVDRRGLTAKRLVFDTQNGPAYGVVCSLPPHLAAEKKDEIPKIDEMAVDFGFQTKQEAEKVLSLGDRGVPTCDFLQLQNGRISSKALDNRAGCVAVFLAAKALFGLAADCNVGVAVCFSSQEETGCAGAITQAFSLAPTHAICVDVSFAKQKGTDSAITATLGGGPILALTPTMNRAFSKQLQDVAKAANISLQYEVDGSSSGTNGDRIALAGGGVITAVLSVPLQYMHSICETVDPKDVKAVADLMVQAALHLGQAKREEA